MKSEYPNGKIFWLTYFPEVTPESVDQPMGFRNEDLVWLRSLDFIMAINLDKEPEAYALMNQLNIQNKYGFGLKKGMTAPLNENANHKNLTGISDSYSKSNECINGRSCIKEISAEKVLAEIKKILSL